MNWLEWLPAAREKRIRDFVHRLTGLRPRRGDVKPGAVVYVDERGWLAASNPAGGTPAEGVFGSGKLIGAGYLKLGERIIPTRGAPTIEDASGHKRRLNANDVSLNLDGIDLSAFEPQKDEKTKRITAEMPVMRMWFRLVPPLPDGFVAVWDLSRASWVAVRVADRRMYAVMGDGSLVPLDEREGE